MPTANIAHACAIIERDLSARHLIAGLARACAMAEHHFQRKFAAATGETVAGYVRSRRLEAAALALEQSNRRVLDIALDCGFETHAALTRAFTSHFGISPSAFRKHGLAPEAQGVAPRPYLKPIASQALSWSYDCVEMPDQWLCWRRAKGMAEGRFFPDLRQTAVAFRALATELAAPEITFASGYPEGPAAFEDPTAVAHFGALLNQQHDLTWPEGWTQIKAGAFAVFPHHGPLTTLHLTWHRAVRVGLAQLGLALRAGWMFETYLTNQIDTSRDLMTALIYLPVQESTFGKA